MYANERSQPAGNLASEVYEHMPMALPDLMLGVDALRGAKLRAHSPESVEKRIGELFSESPRLGINRDHNQIWYRARTVTRPDGFINLHECIYPPAEAVKYFGRANYPEQPTFYAAWNIATALDEIRAEPGQLVQITAARPRKGRKFPFHIVGEIEHVFHAGRSLVEARPEYLDKLVELITGWPDDIFKANVFLDGFMAQQYSRTAEGPFEYKLTAAYAKPVFKSGHGLMYPSVQLRGGVNAAIPAAEFDEHFEVVWTEEVLVKNYYDYGLYDLEGRRFSSEFEEDGTILWGRAKQFDVHLSLQAGSRILQDIDGWRVKK